MSPKGPWRESRHARVCTYFHPVCQYEPNAALKDHRLRRDSADELAQSLSLLSAHYGSTLSAKIMWSDPFYTLTELFNFFISSEMQFLNSIATKLDDGTQGLSFADPSASIDFQAELLYFRRSLDKHVQCISQTLMFIRSRHHLGSPRSREAIDDSQIARSVAKADLAATQLDQDCEYALNCAISLRQRCERETTIMMNNASIAEAKRGIDQGRQVFRFSVLVSIYVPLSFTSSVFGMNFVQFSNHAMGFWVWPLVTLPIFVASLLILIWDFESVRQWRARTIHHLVGRPGIER